jgi:hypothetical protein
MPSGGAHDSARPWEADEDVLVTHMVSTMGRRWKHIAKLFPGRTISSVRNRWQRMAQREEPGKKAVFKNRCALCGERKRGHTCLKRLSPAALMLGLGEGETVGETVGGARSGAREAKAPPLEKEVEATEPENELSGTEEGLSEDDELVVEGYCTEEQLDATSTPPEDPILRHHRGWNDCPECDSDPPPWARVSLADAVVNALHDGALSRL